MSLKVSDGEFCASACPSVDKARVWVLSQTHSVFPSVCVRMCVPRPPTSSLSATLPL